MSQRIDERSETAERILEIAQELIQTRGYSAFSYQDIADRIGIRKASIHYHFPSKADLGRAVVQRYIDTHAAMLQAAGQFGAMAALEAYFAPFLAMVRDTNRVCLCGALAGEALALPDAMRTQVVAFFNMHQTWIAGILAQGAAEGALRLQEPPEQAARLIFSALQGAVLGARVGGQPQQVEAVVASIKARLGLPG